MFRIIILILLTAEFCFGCFTSHLAKSRIGLPLPENVKDIYDSDTYSRWLEYSQKRRTLSSAHSALVFAVLLICFAFNVFARLSSVLPGGRYLNQILMLAVVIIVSDLIDIPFSYAANMKIEEEYGFNRMSGKTFAGDKIKSLIMSLLLSSGAAAAFIFIIGNSAGSTVIWVYVLIAAVIILLAVFGKHLRKLFNKFAPLPEGELRDKIDGIFRESGYTVKNIFVMDASRRTSKVNAYCSGLGRSKEIVLFDNLVNNYSTDEIAAVFLHELAHYRSRDTLRFTVIQMFAYIPILLLLLWLVSAPSLLGSLGFGSINAAMIMILLSAVLAEPLLVLVNIPLCAYSRKCEYRADMAAVSAGFGKAMKDVLRKLSKDNFSDLNPHPLLVKLAYTHPPVSLRIAAIDDAERPATV
ncbi:MAG: M48 family metallopeptidase [Eubacteriaceae bacterium]|jgi:STE24 endopeptidase|nr:M48 family metallopeptidase [Eubacteriaceae bacterium]